VDVTAWRGERAAVVGAHLQLHPKRLPGPRPVAEVIRHDEKTVGHRNAKIGEGRPLLAAVGRPVVKLKDKVEIAIGRNAIGDELALIRERRALGGRGINEGEQVAHGNHNEGRRISDS
jgi:hypothetical protein